MTVPATTSQTVGPYFKIGLQWLYHNSLAPERATGEHVTIQGRVLDGESAPVSDAILEIWQANTHGKYAHPDDSQDKPLEPGFTGFGRVPVDPSGTFQIITIKPGPVPGPHGKVQAPHLVISVFMRGLLKRLVTRMYFPNEALNASDPILNLVVPARRPTLIAKASGSGQLEWNIVLQGSNETVYFDIGL